MELALLIFAFSLPLSRGNFISERKGDLLYVIVCTIHTYIRGPEEGGGGGGAGGGGGGGPGRGGECIGHFLDGEEG